MILVTGATGQFGGKTIDHLIKSGVNPTSIAALVRDEAKAKVLKEQGIEVRVGDYRDHDSLIRGLKGIHKLLLVSSNDRQAIENRTAQHISVIKAAKEAEVKHIIYTSFVRKPGFEESAIAAFQNSHVQSEAFLKESGIEYTILQNGIYMEMIPIFTGSKVAETGIILFPAGAGKASFVLREELAEAAAYILATKGHENKTYILANGTSASFYDIAAALSSTFGKDVSYQSPSVEDFELTLKKSGVPDIYIGMFTMWANALSQNTLDTEDNTLEKFLRRKPTSVNQYVDSVYRQNSIVWC